jgi:ubiquinone/menaquinone biosynthesis C-methylase UbiE
MDAHALDLPDDYYDIATSGLVIPLVADRCVLTELARVLRPGGTVALTTPWPCEDGSRWDSFSRLVAEYERRAAPLSWRAASTKSEKTSRTSALPTVT